MAECYGESGLEGEWPSELRCYNGIRGFIVRTPLGAQPDLGTKIVTRINVTARGRGSNSSLKQ